MLVAVDWAQWQRDAGDFLRKHPGAKVKELTRAERLLVPQARAAWAVVHFRAGAVAREHGAQPCDLCGEWTGSFCEGCAAVPYAVCTACDADRLLCPPLCEPWEALQWGGAHWPAGLRRDHRLQQWEGWVRPIWHPSALPGQRCSTAARWHLRHRWAHAVRRARPPARTAAPGQVWVCC